MTEKLLKLIDLYKTFQKSGTRIEVLRGVNLDISYKESIAIVGQSGSGKSTFLQMLGLLDRPTGGTIDFFGHKPFTSIQLSGKSTSMSKSRIDKIRNQEIGFIFQFHHLLPDHSASQNVMMPLLIAGVSERKARERANTILERVGLQDRLEHRPGELSGGEQQRVAIARALIAKPKLVLADEPTGNLDPATATSIMDLLLSLTEELEGTLVMVTHNLELAKRCQRVLRLQEGLFTEEL